MLVINIQTHVIVKRGVNKRKKSVSLKKTKNRNIPKKGMVGKVGGAGIGGSKMCESKTPILDE